MTFAENLKAIRTARGMTQDDLAALIKTTKQVISRYESGARTPKISVAQQIAVALNVPLPQLLGDDEPPLSTTKQSYIDKIMAMPDDEVARLDRLLDDPRRYPGRAHDQGPGGRHAAHRRFLPADAEL